MLFCYVQEAGLKVREYELIRRNFSISGNFGKQRWGRRLCSRGQHAAASMV
jgi:hypothetical protein